jgi:hypothetical protein
VVVRAPYEPQTHVSRTAFRHFPHPQDICFSTSLRVAIEVSPGVVEASAPCAAPYSTAFCASLNSRKPNCTPDAKVQAHITRKNGNPVPIKWQFENEEARIKLHSIYPSI